MSAQPNMTPFRIPLRLRVQRKLRWALPVLFWSAAVVAVGFLWSERPQTADVSGFAREMRFRVRPTTPGRIKELEVTLHQRVNKSQLLAVLDDEHVRTALATARGELDRLRSEVRRAREIEVESDVDARHARINDLRRFARDIEAVEIASLEASTRLAESEAELLGVKIQLERARGLVKQDVGSVTRVDTIEARKNTLEARIAATKNEKANLARRLEQARERYENWRTSVGGGVSIESMIRPLEDAVRVQELRLAELKVSMQRLVLRSPTTGIVAKIQAKVGEYVDPAQSVLEVVEEDVREVVAWLPEARVGEVLPGTRASVRARRRTSPLQLETSVRAVGASLELVPERLQPAPPMTPLWGQAVFLRIPRSVNALPGEAFDVRFEKRGVPAQPATSPR